MAPAPLHVLVLGRCVAQQRNYGTQREAGLRARLAERGHDAQGGLVLCCVDLGSMPGLDITDGDVRYVDVRESCAVPTPSRPA